MNYCLNEDDIYKLIGHTNIIKYPDLQKYKSILDCFDHNGRFVIFFETVNNYSGHWECCFKIGNVITFWDSYGLAPDQCKEYINKRRLIKLKEFKPVLMDMLNSLADNGFKVIYNTIQYQSWADAVDTCGRWVSLRLMHKNMNEKQFYSFVEANQKYYSLPTLDDVAIQLTKEILKK